MPTFLAILLVLLHILLFVLLLSPHTLQNGAYCKNISVSSNYEYPHLFFPWVNIFNKLHTVVVTCDFSCKESAAFIAIS